MRTATPCRRSSIPGRGRSRSSASPKARATPTRKQVTAQFRAKMRTVHPDHGGDHTVASTAMFELAEARRILTDAAPN